MTRQRALIVDDEPDIRELLEITLGRMKLDTRSARNVKEAREWLAKEPFDLCLTDMRLPDGTGLDLVQHILQRHPHVPVAMITAYGSLDTAINALKAGAFDFLTKPVDLGRLRELVAAALRLRSADGEELPVDSRLLGDSPPMQAMRKQILKLARSQAPVYISGESGSGKELVARALHRHSPRAKGPFIALNTAAIPKDLLESELFGHERGAFTGAAAQRRGRFEQADEGTLFLDEIGDMPAELQTRLLRVLSDGQFYRVGGHTPIKVNVRVIAATHQDLEERVQEGLFREDLFHRLNVIRLRLPPLRERREDIPLLVRHFMQKSARDLGVEIKGVSDAALKTLVSLPWSGNVRQLENVSHYLTVMAPGQVVEVGDLPSDLMQGGAAPSAGDWLQGLAAEASARLARGEAAILDELTQDYEKTLIEVALRHTGGRRIEASHLLGWGRNTLTRKIHELGMDNAPEADDVS